MSIRAHSVVLLACAALMIMACENRASQATSPTPVNTAQPAALGPAAQLAAKGALQHVVTLFDACDPETFDAVLGAGACTRSGGVRFATFLDQLTKHHSIGAWHFAP